jgi:hypothetical protein
MAFLRTNWAIITALAAIIYFAGGQGNKIAALEDKISSLEEMKRDIAVIKQRVEWIADRALRSDREDHRTRK